MAKEGEGGVKGIKDYGTVSDKQLRRALNRWELLFLSLGGVIGSGWLFGSLYTAAYAGGAAILSWLIAGILVIFIGLSYAEIGAAIPKSGGIVRYPHYTHGGVAGYIISWAYFLSAASVPAIEATATITYLSALIPSLAYPNGVLTPLGILSAYILLILFFLLQYAGVNWTGKVTHIAGWWKLIIPSLTVLILLVLYFHPSNFTLGGGFFPAASMNAVGLSGFAPVLFAIPATGVIFSYLGFRQAVEYGGEGKNPKKDIPFAVIGSLLIGIALYTLLQVAYTGGIDWSTLVYNNKPVVPGNWTALEYANSSVTGAPLTSGPFYEIFKSAPVVGAILSLFSIFSIILLIDAVISPSGTGWIYTGTAGRTIYGFASNGYLPGLFLKIGKTKVPVFSLIAATIIAAIFMLPFPSWESLVSFISSATVFTYVMGGIGLETLRRTAPDLKRSFTVPGAKIIAPIATAAAGLIVYWSSYETLFYLIVAIFIGLPIFFGYYATKLGMPKVYSYILGGVDIVVVLLSSFLYYFAAYNASAKAFTNNLLAFGIYIVVMAALVASNVLILFNFTSADVKKEIKASLWLFGLIFAIFILSYFGSLGPDTIVPFPYDVIIAAVIFLIFHYLAVKSGFRTDAIEDIIEQTKEP
ncbi:amino acid permease [Acidianus sulfidivorans JP7]|uniref:Amino acid permease n=1 Tax=Acidianus sulfidivorans JP7 TaxID=619593 RepID=A0A2U9IK24_9CREN|nr:APC family permease [Acidianus sulfidivorans]AWR96373.1 amino acid permease [Acidianus sulfidivorans JP7]